MSAWRPEGQGYSVTYARYAKGKMLVRAPGENGFKSRAARLITALGGRWTNREDGYVCSHRAVDRLETLFREGWDASFFDRSLIPPRPR